MIQSKIPNSKKGSHNTEQNSAVFMRSRENSPSETNVPAPIRNMIIEIGMIKILVRRYSVKGSNV